MGIKRIKSIFTKLLFSFNLLAAIGLLFAYCAQYVSPNTTTFFSYFGLLYPLFLLLNVVFVVFWMFKLNIRVLLSMLVLLLGWSIFSQFFQFSFSSSKKEESSLNIMSYNVRLFNKYKWTKESGVQTKILNELNKHAADVICFQEYYSENNEAEVRAQLKMPYSFLYIANKNNRNGKGSGLAIFSKYKIVDQGTIVFENEKYNNCIYVDVLVDDDTVRVYNGHLASIKFDYEDYKYMESDHSESLQNEVQTLGKVLGRLGDGFRKRTAQVSKVLTHISKCQYPVVLGVDLNATSTSYAYKRLTDELMDSFVENGKGISSTYLGVVPCLRIDYLFHNSKVSNVEFKTIEMSYSDHKPVYGRFKVENSH